MKTLFTPISLLLFAVLSYLPGLNAQSPQKMSYQAVIRNSNGDLVTNHEVGMKVSILQGSETGTLIFREIYNPNPQTNSNGLVTLEIGSGIPLTGSFSEIDWSNVPYFLKIETDPSGGTTYSLVAVSELLSVPYALFAQSVSNPGSTLWHDGDGVVTTSEKVGIGTNSPIGKLEVRGSNPDDGVTVTIGNSDDTHAITIFGGRQNDPNPFIRWNDGDPLRFVTTQNGWDEKMRISSNGNVGIGVSEVTEKLEVNGNVDVHDNYIKNVADPVNEQDAATKAYVDSILNAFGIVLPDNFAGTVTDVDGNIYRTVTIGTQTWMAENLRVGRYKNGTLISQVTSNTDWNNLSTGACCYYDNNKTLYGTIYGALYNWYAVNTGNLCPQGWHVPSDAEWTTLTTYLGGINVAGGKLRETGNKYWNMYNYVPTNETGFSALPGDSRQLGEFTGYLGIYGYWWTSTAYSTTNAWYRSMACNEIKVGANYFDKKSGFSVRCIKD